MKAQIMTPSTAYITDYPVAISTARQQFATSWSAEELGVEKDENDLRTLLSEGELHGVTHVLKLFTQYELEIGEEFWTGKFKRLFPRHDIRRGAIACGNTETNSHAPFYALCNETLNLATPEFYNAWRSDPVLVDRMTFVEDHLATQDPYACLAAFSFVEGAVLYSSFAYLKSFNMNGFGLIPHIAAGIDASCKDEHSHFMFSSWTFRQLMLEEEDLGLIDDARKLEIQAMCRKLAETVYEHEKLIIREALSRGGIRTITEAEMLHFVQDRIDAVLQALSCPAMFNQEEGVISEWFGDAISLYKFADFFANNQIQYVRTWDRGALKFDPNPDAPAENMTKFLR